MELTLGHGAHPGVMELTLGSRISSRGYGAHCGVKEPDLGYGAYPVVMEITAHSGVNELTLGP